MTKPDAATEFPNGTVDDRQWSEEVGKPQKAQIRLGVPEPDQEVSPFSAR